MIDSSRYDELVSADSWKYCDNQIFMFMRLTCAFNRKPCLFFARYRFINTCSCKYMIFIWFILWWIKGKSVKSNMFLRFSSIYQNMINLVKSSCLNFSDTSGNGGNDIDNTNGNATTNSNNPMQFGPRKLKRLMLKRIMKYHPLYRKWILV